MFDLNTLNWSHAQWRMVCCQLSTLLRLILTASEQQTYVDASKLDFESHQNRILPISTQFDCLQFTASNMNVL